MAWWDVVANPVRSATGALAGLGTALGNRISGTPIGSVVGGAGDVITRAAQSPESIGRFIGNAVNAPGQRNPLGFARGVIESPVGAGIAGAANFTQSLLPWRPLGNAVNNLRQGNYGSYWGNIGLAGLNAYGPGRLAGGARTGISGATGAGGALLREAKFPAGIALAGMGLTRLAGETGSPAILPAAGTSPFMTADMAQRRADQAMLNGQKLNQSLDSLSSAFARANTPVDTSAVTGVGAPTGDMMAQYEELLRQAQQDYEQRMADLAEARAVAEEDYRLGTRRSRRGTAGRSANLSALLSAAGLDLSPAAAEGGLGYEAQRGARELAGLERTRMQTRTGATRAEAEADTERKRRIAELNRYLMTAPAAAAGNAPVPGM